MNHPHPKPAAKRPWHIHLRTLHLVTSLAMAGLLTFYAVTGFIGNRAAWFQSEEIPTPSLHLPDGITLDDAGLGPWAAGAFQLPAPVTPWTTEGETLKAQAKDALTTDILALTVDVGKRQVDVIRWHPLPEDLSLTTGNLLAFLRERVGGEPDEKNAEDDTDHLRIDLESVWGSRSITVDRHGHRWQMTAISAAWPTALVDLHRGKHAGPVQRILIDITAVILLLLVISGIAIAWSLVKKRRLVFSLTLGSLVLLAFVLIGR